MTSSQLDLPRHIRMLMAFDGEPAEKVVYDNDLSNHIDPSKCHRVIWICNCDDEFH